MPVKWYGDDILQQIRDAQPDGMFAGGQMLVESAAANVRRVSGDLAASGYVSMEGKSTYKKRKNHLKETKATKGGAVAGFAAFYGKFVEFGTKNAAARPFFRPAIDELKEQIGEEVAITMKKRFK